MPHRLSRCHMRATLLSSGAKRYLSARRCAKRNGVHALARGTRRAHRGSGRRRRVAARRRKKHLFFALHLSTMTDISCSSLVLEQLCIPPSLFPVFFMHAALSSPPPLSHRSLFYSLSLFSCIPTTIASLHLLPQQPAQNTTTCSILNMPGSNAAPPRHTPRHAKLQRTNLLYPNAPSGSFI